MPAPELLYFLRSAAIFCIIFVNPRGRGRMVEPYDESCYLRFIDEGFSLNLLCMCMTQCELKLIELNVIKSSKTEKPWVQVNLLSITDCWKFVLVVDSQQTPGLLLILKKGGRLWTKPEDIESSPLISFLNGFMDVHPWCRLDVFSPLEI